MTEGRKEKLYVQVASILEAKFAVMPVVYNRWVMKGVGTIQELCREHMPSGSGVDNGTKFDFGASKIDRLVFTAGFHHMNSHGFYTEWTQHQFIVTPSFSGINIRITGRNRNDIKEYLHEVFHFALVQEVPVR